ncbi:MAG: hypothetical protein LUG54_09235 [Clostridiales bacterium]|nr:hypothetical protein [Clostridiales bacterium]
MYKKMNSVAIAVVLGIMSVCASGCGSDTQTDESSENIQTEELNESETQTTDESAASDSEKAIDIEDIVWSVDEGIIDGDRYVLLEYTNNSSYTITGLEITFREKSDITDEEKSSFYSDVQELLDATDEDMEEITNEEISMYAKTDRVVDAGESASNINCYYYSGYYYLKDINHYNLVEPDILTVKFIDGDEIYTVYYDYVSQKYSFEDDTEVAYQWSQTDLGDAIPKPDVKVVEAGRDDEVRFMFDAYGLTLDEFNAYVDECIELGYTVDASSYEGFYTADNEEGYNVYLYYQDNDYSMSGTVEAPETDE